MKQLFLYDTGYYRIVFEKHPEKENHYIGVKGLNEISEHWVKGCKGASVSISPRHMVPYKHFKVTNVSAKGYACE